MRKLANLIVYQRDIRRVMQTGLPAFWKSSI